MTTSAPGRDPVAAEDGRPTAAGTPEGDGTPEADVPASLPGQPLLSIGAAAAKANVSERALRYYQQLGLLTPAGCTPGGMRRYSPDDLARVARIRQCQTLLGLNLDEIAVVLRNEDRMAEIRQAYHHQRTSDAERRALAAESLALQLELRATVAAKRAAIEGFLADLDARIARIQDLLAEMAGAAPATATIA